MAQINTKHATITYQGLLCASVDISRSLSVDPDIATVDIPIATFNQVLLADEAKPPLAKSASKLQQPGGFTTTVSPEESDPLKKYQAEGSPLTLKQQGTLILEDHENAQKLIFNHMYISKGGVSSEEGQIQNKLKSFPKFMRLELADERRFWRERGVIEDDYNVIDSSGKVIGDNAYRENTLNGDKLYSLKELINICVAQLATHRANRYSVYRFNLGAPIDNIFPTLLCGGGRNPAEALDELLQGSGLYLSLLIQPGQYGLGPDPKSDPANGNIIVITERGQTDQLEWVKSLKARNRLKPEVRKLQPVYRPYGARVTSTKRIIREITVTDFEPVVQDPDKAGAWVKLDSIGLDMDYIKKQALKHFSEKEKGFLKFKKTNKSLMHQLQQQAFKCFRMKLNDSSVLPMNAERKFSDDDKMTGSPPFVICDYFLPTENKDPSQGLWENFSGELPGDKEPRFDLNAGVVKFPQPVGTIVRQPKKGKKPGEPEEATDEEKEVGKKIERTEKEIEKAGKEKEVYEKFIDEQRDRIDYWSEGAQDEQTGKIIANAYERIEKLEAERQAKVDEINKLKENIQDLKDKAHALKVAKDNPIYNLEEAEIGQGEISVQFQYESNNYWHVQIGDRNHSAVIQKDWEVYETDGYDNTGDLVTLANAEALKLYSGRDRVIGYEIEAVGFWPIVADGDRPRVAWRYNANGDFKPATLFQYDDFTSPFAGRPEVGYKTRAE